VAYVLLLGGRVERRALFSACFTSQALVRHVLYLGNFDSVDKAWWALCPKRLENSTERLEECESSTVPGIQYTALGKHNTMEDYYYTLTPQNGQILSSIMPACLR
jgi:hypothetical protein